MNKNISNQEIPQHSLGKSIGLHILPGILVTGAFLVLKPLLDSSGFPPLFAFLLAVLLLGLPVMLSLMLWEGKKLNGRFSLEGVVLYREKVSWKTFLLVFIGTFIVVYFFTMVMTPINDLLMNKGFSWLPDWFFLDEQTQYQSYSGNVLKLVFSLQLLLTGLFLPWVEELYFRGFLLPRISRYGKWAPILGGVLFGFYHIWQLFSFPTVFILGTLLGYIVWWKRDIRISISLHVVANALIRVMILFTVFI